MSDKLSIALAQIDPTVGDIAGNARRIIAAWDEAKGAEIGRASCRERV